MKYPNEFYYNESISHQTYSNTSTHLLDVDRVIRGEKPWKVLTFTKERKPKTLLISDWTAINWSDTTINNLKTKLLELLTAEFPIYIICIDNEDKLIQLTENNLSILNDINFRRTIKPAYKEEITQIAYERASIVQDQIYILDRYNLQRLLNNVQNPSSKQMSLTELLSQDQEQWFKIIDIENKSKPAITKIHCDVLSDNSRFSNALTFLKNQFPNAKVNTEYLKLIFTTAITIEEIIPKEKFSINGIFVSINELEKTKQLCSESHQTGFELLIQAMPNLEEINFTCFEGFNFPVVPNLKYLNLSCCKNLSFPLFLAIDSLPHLEKIDLSSSNCSTTNLQILILVAPNLKYLHLSHCKNLSSTIALTFSPLLQLETINLSDSNCSTTNLQILISVAPNLKSLDLSYCRNLSSTILLTFNPLPHLEKIDLSNSNCSTTNLQILISVAPNLKYLNLSHCKNLSAPLSLTINSLLYLETIDLRVSNCSITNLQALIFAAPNLKYLYLSHYKIFSSTVALTFSPLLQLENINLCYSDCSTINLQAFILAAPNLKCLNLSCCRNLSSIGFLRINALPHLEKIDLFYSDCPITNLQALILAAPNLKYLNLSYCKNLSSIGFLRINTLPHLEKINLSSSDCSITSLQALSFAAPNLKYLDLSFCKNLSPTAYLTINTLPHLENIDLCSSDCSIINLKKLIFAAPHIKYLGLSNCKNFLPPLLLKFNALPHLETIDLSSSNYSITNLHTLIAAAPNLKSLNLSHCSHLSSPISLTFNVLPHLERIDLSHSNCSITNLNKFIFASPNLKYLNLRHCTFNSDNSTLTLCSLTKLEKLYLPHGNLINFIEILPNLKKLTLGIEQNLENFKALIKSMPNLQELELINYGEQLALLMDRFLEDQQLKSIITHDYNILYYYLKNTIILEKFITDFISQVSINSYKNTNFSSSTYPNNQDSVCYESAKQTQNHFFHPFDEITFDAKTKLSDSSEIVFAKKVFYSLLSKKIDPELAAYRNTIFNKLILSPKPILPDKAFILTNEENLQLCPPKNPIIFSDKLIAFHAIEKKENAYQYYGTTILSLDTKWLPLPSLSPNETISHCYISQQQGIEIQYSKRHNLYYIRSNENTVKQIAIQYIIEVPNQKPIEFPDELKEIVNHYNSFHGGELILNTDCPTSKDYLAAIERQKVGSCRHRSVAAKAKIDNEYPNYKTRIVTNDCHIFIEIFINNQWVTCDLGGYPIQLKIDDDPSSFRAFMSEQNKSYTNAIPFSRNIPDQSEEKRQYYRERLTTWKNTSLTIYDKKYYFQKIIANESHGKNRLIHFTASETIFAFQLALQQYCRAISYPVFYIDHPDELVCSAPVIACNDKLQGQLKSGPAGKLHNFLMDYCDKPSLLIINYANFEIDDIVRNNAMLDETRRADGTPIAENTLIIGLNSPDNPDAYTSADFYSRFNHREYCPINEQTILAILPTLPEHDDEAENTNDEPENSIRINLYHAADWKHRLLGHWTLDKNRLVYEEGLLITALKQGTSNITIQNGLWQDRAFKQFWQQLLHQKYIEHPTGMIQLPEHFTLSRYGGNQFDLIKSWIIISNKPPLSMDYVINAHQVTHFLDCYDVKNGTLFKEPGIIERHANSILTAYVTHPLADYAWARLLDTCKQHQVTLEVTVANGVDLPEALSATHSTAVDIAYQPHTTLIMSSDIDATLTCFVKQQTEQPPIIINISGSEPSDLLDRIHTTFDLKSLQFNFMKLQGIVLEKLEQGAVVILTGDFSHALVQALAPLLIKRFKDPDNASGELLLINEGDGSLFTYLPYQLDYITDEKKWDCLNLTDPNDGTRKKLTPFIHESLSQLKMRLAFLNAGIAHDPWIGLNKIPTIHLPDQTLDITISEHISKSFIKERRASINAILTIAPYVFITGLTGVGKTTFVEKEFCQSGDTLYIGETAIEDWITHKTEKRAILFLDEANLSYRNWREFEGLFNTPPTIQWNYKLYFLTKKHKVIFAGNPINYSGERKLAHLFKQHGNAILFDPLPIEVIYEKILKPVFENTIALSQEMINGIHQHILSAYRFICHCSTTRILISPRELQMMALLILNQKRLRPMQDIEMITKSIIYTIGRTLIPDSHAHDFKGHFAPEMQTSIATEITTLQTIHITASRKPLVDLMYNWLNLPRNHKTNNETQKYGGLGGIIIEGNSGIGKTGLMIELLISQGYQEEDHAVTPTTKLKPFYRLPVSMNLAAKETLLLKAFDEGAIVIIDEINSSPMLEQLLNSLLMGKKPNGNPPQQAGFMVIGTQNPATLPGRKNSSEALSRRLLKLKLPDYTKDEVEAILITQGLKETEAALLAETFIERQNIAYACHKTPAPTLRDLRQFVDTLPRKLLFSLPNKKETKCSSANKTPSPLIRLSTFSDSKIKNEKRHKNGLSSSHFTQKI